MTTTFALTAILAKVNEVCIDSVVIMSGSNESGWNPKCFRSNATIAIVPDRMEQRKKLEQVCVLFQRSSNEKEEKNLRTCKETFDNTMISHKFPASKTINNDCIYCLFCLFLLVIPPT